MPLVPKSVDVKVCWAVIGWIDAIVPGVTMEDVLPPSCVTSDVFPLSASANGVAVPMGVADKDTLLESELSRSIVELACTVEVPKTSVDVPVLGAMVAQLFPLHPLVHVWYTCVVHEVVW